MTTVVSNPVTVQIVTSGPYASYTDGQTKKILQGDLYNYGGLGEPAARELGYSGGCIDSSTGYFYYTGGGHADGFSNSVWRINVDALNGAGVLDNNTWERDRPPDHTSEDPVSMAAYGLALLPIGSSDSGNYAYDPQFIPKAAALDADTSQVNYPGGFISKQRPISRHTYYSVRMLSAHGKIFVSGGSLYGGSGTEEMWSHWGNSHGDQWLYTPATKAWELMGTPLTHPLTGADLTGRPYAKAGLLNGICPIAYSAALGKYIGVGASGNNYSGASQIALFDPATKAWTIVPGSRCDLAALEWMQLPVYDPVRNKVYLFGVLDSSTGANVYTYDMNNVGATSWTLTRARDGNEPTFETANGDNAVFSNWSNKPLLYAKPGTARGNKLWRYDPDANTWQLVKDNPFGTVYQAYPMDWCPTRKVGFLLCEDRSNTSVVMWAFRA